MWQTEALTHKLSAYHQLVSVIFRYTSPFPLKYGHSTLFYMFLEGLDFNHQEMQ